MNLHLFVFIFTCWVFSFGFVIGYCIGAGIKWFTKKGDKNGDS
jgi:hypothetical protein